MPEIVGGKRPAETVVREVDPISKPGCVIDGLTVRICGEEGKIRCLSLHRNLERVVIRVRDIGGVRIPGTESRAKRSSCTKNLLAIRERVGGLLAVRSTSWCSA